MGHCALLAAALCAASMVPQHERRDAFLAVGVISAPEYVHRRTVLRSTWMELASADASVSTTFVVRAAHAPSRMRRSLGVEAERQL